MGQEYFLMNRLNMETMQWEYAPRHASVENGRVIVTEVSKPCSVGGIDDGHVPYQCALPDKGGASNGD